MSLDEEQTYLAEVGRAQSWMLDHARMRVATGEQVAGDRYTAETLGRMLKSYAKELADEPEAPPFFGRLTFGESPGRQLTPAFGMPPELGADPEAGDRYHIGRRRITDEAGTPLVIDWRAPVSARFYRAGAREPMGVATRRRYGWTVKAPIRLTGFEDEHLDLGEEIGTASRLLTAEIERPRVGPMRDIVATIQPEQDELVRADLSVSLCVQGGPGTGKTAVGLHRAAFLLYAHRAQLARTGVMVVGPNAAFLQYISAVLPALGEINVSQRTLGSVISDVSASSVDAPAAAQIKHDVRMAAVLRRALYALIAPPTTSLLVPDGSYRLRVDAGVLARQVSEISASDVPYQIGRDRLRARILGLLQRQLEWHGESPTRAWLDKIGRSAPVRAVLDASWPRVRPAELLATLLGNPEVLARAAEGILTDEEQATIRWRRPRSFRTARWSPADLVLLDEIAGLIAHPDGFGHIVVDEAQDLSPMECRALARRSRHGSLTVLGDLAQGTSPWAAADWPTQMAHLGKPDGPVTALTLGFRVPGAVLDLANRLLPALRVAAPQTRAVRTDGALDIHPVTDLPAAVSDRVGAALEQEGSIAVIATEERLATLPPSSDPRVTMLPATLAKGLEFDHVIVVEPTEIVRSEERGPHRLYVVLTRAVSRLDVLHAEPLPDFFPLTDRTAVEAG